LALGQDGASWWITLNTLDALAQTDAPPSYLAWRFRQLLAIEWVHAQHVPGREEQDDFNDHSICPPRVDHQIFKAALTMKTVKSLAGSLRME